MGNISLAERASHLKLIFILQMSSSFYKKTEYTPREQETAWLNIVNATHDMFCFCNTPWNHLLQSVLQRGSTFELDPKSIRLMQKCLISGKEDGGNPEKEETTTNTKEETGFDIDAGDLEKLFALDDEETG